jgi:hypothetical protein
MDSSYDGVVTGIDPGTDSSAWVSIKGGLVVGHGYEKNEKLADKMRASLFSGHVVGIEMVASYGMPVGESTFETVFWIGSFWECCRYGGVERIYKLYRKQDREFPAVCMHLCKSNRAKDANVKTAIMDLYSPTGGGKEPVVGTKLEPGPLYGITSHKWQALAVAITCRDNLPNLT